jgi:sigma-B regulation protein RsbU (phosphoserine phosphatase)
MITVCLDHISKEQKHALEDDLELAGKIQRGFLPKETIVVDGWEFSYKYKPVGIVSGDFCDFIPLDNSSFFFALGDVSGKGISASLMMSQLHALTRSFVSFGFPLNEMVRRINRLFCESILSNNFATMVFGKAMSNGTIEFCIAGHNPPMLLKANEITKINATGIPVGLFCNSIYDVSEFSLESGNTILFYTDGITESFSNSKAYGEHRLTENFLSAGDKSSESIIKDIITDHSLFMKDSKVTDDITIAVLKKI